MKARVNPYILTQLIFRLPSKYMHFIVAIIFTIKYQKIIIKLSKYILLLFLGGVLEMDLKVSHLPRQVLYH